MADQNTGFNDLGLRPEILQALSELGYEEPTPIQRASIPPLLAGRDLLGQAATGTGKTAAFALPILSRWAELGETAHPTALVLVPTRELAMQVAEAMHKYGRRMGARVLPIYGGQPIARQLQALRRGVDIVVATPGRALDHIGRKTLRTEHLSVVVLDEADEMLDMGFAEDIEAILRDTPADRQTILFSATLPPRVGAIAKKYLHNPERIEIARAQAKAGEAPKIRQTAYIVPRAHKLAALGRVLDVESPTAGIVFCRTRTEVDQLTEALNGRGYRAESLHGGMTQELRDRVMGRLRNGTAELLIATDVAARGLDIDTLTHVVNYDVPSDPDSYVHRIGRVGRAGRQGVAITLAEPREHRQLKIIERLSGRIAIEKVPTVADLQARRLELTTASLREAVMADDFDQFRVVIETLSDDFDLMDIAVAAVKLLHEAETGGAKDEQDIPDAQPRNDAPPRGSGGPARGAKGAPRRGRAPSGNMARLHLSAGRAAGIRPQDIVGAIANEAGLDGRDIGAIEITDRFSLVEVPAAAATAVIAALRNTTIKGKRVAVKRDQDGSG
jgi:ATP-dependent RNA helicase DeaD